MLATTSGPDGGRRLRAERKRLRLSTRDVERISQAIALKLNDPAYYISHTWVADVESGKLRPKLCKLQSLSLIYQCGLVDILGFLGLDIPQASKEQGLVSLPNTCLVPPSLMTSSEPVSVPLELRDRVSLGETHLVKRMFEKWGDLPVGLLQQVNSRNALYGYVGTDDYTLFPVVRPGSFVLIDPRQRRIYREGWQGEHDRPIYFVELRDGYICCWCEVNGNQLVLIPSPQSGRQAKHVRYPGDADILGRVTVVTMPMVEVPIARPF